MKRNAEETGQATVLEEGEIFFYFRPRAGGDDPDGDGRRLFMILHPLRKSRYRLIALGRRHTPAFKGAAPRLRASIDKVMPTLEELREALTAQEYRAGNRGNRIRPAALQAAEGIYAILKYRDDTHLIYALDQPVRDGGLLEEMGVSQEGGYTANVRNPDSVEGAGSGRHPDFPGPLLERFQGKESIPVDPVEFLNAEGAELVLTGVMRDPSEGMGLEFNSRNGSRTGDH
ncbi:MAG TPA: hypothetical protein VJ385_13125 [Fibrobacteria bacterium]|nr:hypothetical protein [Fibrobacteria bacterium]